MEDCFLVEFVERTGVVGSTMNTFLSASKSKISLTVSSPICGTLGSCGGVLSALRITGVVGVSLRSDLLVGEESLGFLGVPGACFLK